MNIREIHIENVRGFRNTKFDLERKNVIFVGPNNTGKTSILILLDWLFNEISDGYLTEGSPMPQTWYSILLPARETRNQARRITLRIEIEDGRKRRKYVHENGEDYIQLRFNIRLSPPTSS